MNKMSDLFKDKDYFYADSLLSKEQEDLIENLCLGIDFPYYKPFCKTTVDEEQANSHPNVRDHQQMVHTIYVIEQSTNNTKCMSDHHTIVDDMVEIILKHFKVNKVTLSRAKVNLQQQFTDNKPEYFNSPHYDLNYKHWVCIYYINDSDGDTLFFDNIKDCNIIGRVSPKKGRMLFFDGKMLHTSQHPIKSWNRLVINMDFQYD